MTRVLRHLSDTYYRPSWQGGDVQRPLCHRRQLGISPATLCLTKDAALVTCNKCRAKLAMEPLPVEHIDHASLPVESPAFRQVGVTRSQIALEVAKDHGVHLAELRSLSRKRVHAWPRQVAMARMIAAGFTTTAAGSYFGRDHTTAIAAKRAIARRLAAQGLA